MTDTREARYAEAIIGADSDITPRRVEAWADAARAVMAVADEELAESRAEAERLKRVAMNNARAWQRETERAEAAEAREAALRARIEALADEWEGWAKFRSTPRIDAFRDAAEQVRAALASPAEDTTPTEQQNATLRAQVEQLRREVRFRGEVVRNEREEMRDLRERLTDLADEWERTGERLHGAPAAQTWLLNSSRLRALASPAEDATPTEQQSQGGACQGDPAFDNGGCCPSCKGVGGGGSMGACWDCRGTGHPHENSPAPVADPNTDTEESR